MLIIYHDYINHHVYVILIMIMTMMMTMTMTMTMLVNSFWIVQGRSISSLHWLPEQQILVAINNNQIMINKFEENF